METIFAQATAMGRAGVCVIRISGSQAFAAAKACVGDLPEPRRAGLRRVVGPDGALVDTALVLTFTAPHSFTGEDVVEFQLHGSIAVANAVFDLLLAQPGVRMAEPGEFTRRALLNDRMDLAQVEGLSDLIDAQTEAQRRQAVRVLSGHLGTLVEGWRGKLIRAAALLEATLDFADEEVPVDVTPEVQELVSSVLIEIQSEVRGSRVAERVRNGFEVAIVGPPNVGKSTLLNALARREAAITSEIAGTTRDVIEVRMDIAGIPVTLLDTAGLRESDDSIEALGIERALKRAAEADIRIFLADDLTDVPLKPLDHDIVLHPKADLREDGSGVSGKTGEGVDRLLEDLRCWASKEIAGVGVATHARHRFILKRAEDIFALVCDLLDHGPERYEITADQLRHGIQILEELIGRVDVEALLDEIFAQFCLGK